MNQEGHLNVGCEVVHSQCESHFHENQIQIVMSNETSVELLPT